MPRGERNFAAGDRIMFLRNEHSLGVKNGSLGTVEQVNERALTVELDRADEHTSELQSVMRITYTVFCLKKHTTATLRFEPYVYGKRTLLEHTRFQDTV